MTQTTELTDTIAKLNLRNRCIHAADESGGNISKKFEQLGIDNTAENRIAYRGAMISAPGYGNTIGGVILFDETLRQTYEGKTVRDILKQQGVVIGVKVDAGLQAFGSSKIEQVGKDELAALPRRMEEYKSLDVRFTKFRVVGNIGAENGQQLPSDACLKANAEMLASYAEICHRYGIVPIVEPEVTMDGADTIDQCYDATVRFLKATFAALSERKVALPGVVLKTNMVLAGTKGPRAEETDAISKTIGSLKATVPSEVGAVVFLSGGQSTEDGMRRLEATRKLAKQQKLSYPLSSSFSRALQGPALEEFGAAIRAHSSAAEIKRRTQEKFTEALNLNQKALQASA